MALFSLSLAGLFGRPFWAGRRPLPGKRQVPSRDLTPPPGWPDVPVDALGLFQREGRINAPMDHAETRGLHTASARSWPCAASAGRPQRVDTVDAAQDVLLSRVDPGHAHVPQVSLRLSEHEHDWTDVLLDGAVIVQVPTAALRARAAPRRLM